MILVLVDINQKIGLILDVDNAMTLEIYNILLQQMSEISKNNLDSKEFSFRIIYLKEIFESFK